MESITKAAALVEARSMPEPNSGCWLWLGWINDKGYGLVRFEGRAMRAHRLSFTASGRTIPPGLHLDHKCRVRCCVNPDHLEPVTNKENILRGLGWGGANSRKTHCARGHEFTAANTYVSARGDRGCRTCGADNHRKKYHDRHPGALTRLHSTATQADGGTK